MEIVTLLLDRKSNVNAVSERCPGCPQSPQSRFLRQWPRSLPLPPPPHSPASNGDPSPTSDKEAADVITISALDMLVKAAALAMKQVPDWNASWMDTFILGGYQPYNEHRGGLGFTGHSRCRCKRIVHARERNRAMRARVV
mmetsp:Transcript_13939/g.18979  ORF Transcript_13939/g.18979 Transcript_13939/m.18979 type:complete len:141 (-) Transcript_13939:531-953(-)